MGRISPKIYGVERGLVERKRVAPLVRACSSYPAKEIPLAECLWKPFSTWQGNQSHQLFLMPYNQLLTICLTGFSLYKKNIRSRWDS